MTNLDPFQSSLGALIEYVENERFEGHDPYDTLNAKIDFNIFGKYVSCLATQIQKRNPINIRGLIGIKKEINPKGMGLFLHAYSTLYKLNPNSTYKEKMDYIFSWLLKNYSKGYSGFCCGYNFPWASNSNYLKAYIPSVVVTGFIGKGIFEYFKITKDEKALSVLKSICDFILNDLPLIESEQGVCFGYTPISKGCCYNASLLGAEILARVYSITHNKEYLEYAVKAVDFVIARQKKDGRWNYSVNMDTGIERKQIDFHQGFVLDSIYDFILYTGIEDNKYFDAIKKGAEYYKNVQFNDNGRSFWRIPKKWPVEIHNQSQGIITFSKLSAIDEGYLYFAKTIAEWTIKNMQDKEGYFYYRKYKLYTNKIPFMRWSQAWMMLALATLISSADFADPPAIARHERAG